MTKSTSLPIWLKVLSIIWIVWVFIDYWFKHPLYSHSFGESYAGVVVMHLVVGALSYIGIKKWAGGRISLSSLLVVFLAFLWSSTLVNLLMYSTVEYTWASIGLYLLRTLAFVGIMGVMFWSSYEAGKLLLDGIVRSEKRPAHSVYLATGLCLYMGAIFLTFVLHIFSVWSNIVLLMIPLVWKARSLPSQLAGYRKPLPGLEQSSDLAIVCAILLMLINAITFSYTLSPFPVGFDALNYYINLPKLLAESDHLLRGFQPYNWSLIQAAGIEISGRIEMALILSWAGLLLVQWSTFEVGHRIMKLPQGLILFGVLLFSYMPSVSTQASQELKVDLGLTYMLLAIVLASFHLMSRLQSSKDNKNLLILSGIIGLLGGFALGIKLTAVIALFAIVGIIWYKLLGSRGFIGVFLCCLSLVFLAQLDTKAGLRSYHASVQWLQIVALLGGLGLLAWSAKSNLASAKKAMTLTVTMMLVTGLSFAPWMVKNISEIESPSFTEILNGTSHGPQFNMKDIDRNLRKNNK